MNLDTYIRQHSSLSERELFDPRTGAVQLGQDLATGKQTIVRWDAARVGFDKPTDAELTRIAGLPDGVAPSLIKQECSRRIFDVADEITQLNMAAVLNGQNVLQQDKDAYDQWRSWVASMQAASRDMVTNNDRDYRLDAKWPAIPQAAADLAQKF